MRVRSGRIRRGFIALALLGFAAIAGAAQQAPPPGLDECVQRAQKTFGTPGVSVAIVKDGATVLARGWGLRKLGDPAPVSEKTLFAIASNTKAFTTAALAILVDEKKLAWDDKVRERLPGFAMYDPYVSHEITIRDLLTHRSGMGAGQGDLLFWPATTFTRDDIVRRVRLMKPASSFRSRFAYANVPYVVAGQIIPAITGMSWDEFLRARIFAPLGMKETTTTNAAFGPADDWAAPHTAVGGSAAVIEIQRTVIDNAGPAGSIQSSASEMARWVAMQIGRGRIPGGDGRLFSEARSREMWASETPIPIREMQGLLAPLTPRFSSYALGWFLRDYHGQRLVGHTGGVNGFASRVLLVPEQNLGVIVLTNAGSRGAYESIALHVVDHYLGIPATDWVAAFQARDADRRKAADAAESRQSAERNAGSKPSLAVEKYAGFYRASWYGTMTLREENRRLVFRMDHTPAAVGDLEHWRYDTFKIVWRDRLMDDAFVTFALDAQGRVDHATMAAVSPSADSSFDYQDLVLKPERQDKPETR